MPLYYNKAKKVYNYNPSRFGTFITVKTRENIARRKT
jgi:hypothetical protein